MSNTLGYANRLGYSDIDPFEVIRRYTDRKLQICEMKVAPCPVNMSELEFVAGGFCGTYTNQGEQRWLIESDLANGQCFDIRLHKDGYWYSRGGKYALNDKPIKFYDYNF